MLGIVKLLEEVRVHCIKGETILRNHLIHIHLHAMDKTLVTLLLLVLVVGVSIHLGEALLRAGRDKIEKFEREAVDPYERQMDKMNQREPVYYRRGRIVRAEN